MLPVGIFQPSGEQLDHERNDFSLWRCLIREFAEELLGEKESSGGPINYEQWPFAVELSDAKRDRRVRPYCLGIGVDPLTFATDLLSVVVFDAAVFDALFGELVETNAEGELIGGEVSRIPGIPFNEAHVTQLLSDHPMQSAGAAVLALAWSKRQVLLAA